MDTRPGIKRTLTASLLAVAAAFGMGMPAVGRGAMPMPSIQQMIGVNEEGERRRRRRSRSDIMRRALTWRGIGMFSRGPRWPNVRTLPVPGRQGVKASDGTRYVIFTDGSWRHEVRGLKGQSAIRRHKELRQRTAGRDRVTVQPVEGLLSRAIARAKAERAARDAARRPAAA